MGRTHARVLASAFHPAVVWIGCALGASLTSGCAGPGHLSWSTGQGSPPACACQSNGAQQSKPQNGGSGPQARPAPHTVGQALRAYRDCLNKPLSQRGPALNVGEGRGDIGLSRYPPAEGEREVPAEGPEPPRGAETTRENGSASPPGPTAGDGTRGGSEHPQEWHRLEQNPRQRWIDRWRDRTRRHRSVDPVYRATVSASKFRRGRHAGQHRRARRRHRFEPLSPRRGRAQPRARARLERRRATTRHRFEPLSPRRGRAHRSVSGTSDTCGSRLV